MYGETEINAYFDHTYESGVAISDEVVTFGVGKNASNDITVAPGYAIIKGYWFNSDSARTLPVSADANFPKIVRVVIRLDKSAKNITLALREGAPASTPQVPAVARTSTVHELSLAQVKVLPGGALEIKDERFNTSVCGYIRPRGFKEYEGFLEVMNNTFDEFMAGMSSKTWRNQFIQATLPTGADAKAGSLWIRTY